MTEKYLRESEQPAAAAEEQRRRSVEARLDRLRTRAKNIVSTETRGVVLGLLDLLDDEL